MGISTPPHITLEELLMLDRNSLSMQWQMLFGAAPNRTLRTAFLFQAVSWHIQARMYGGLDSGNRKALKSGLVNECMTVGTRLIREWRGVRYQVTVLAKGFEYEGAEYRSLSAIARKITGTPWNGLIFFGVKK